LTATAYFQRQDRKLRNIDIPVQFPAPTAVTFFPINVFRLNINSDTRQKVVTPGLDVQSTFLLSTKNVLTAGITGYQDQSEDDRNSSSQLLLLGQVALGARGPAAVVFPSPMPLGPPSLSKPVRVPNATFRDLGTFVQDEWDVSSKLRLVAGMRVDSYKMKSKATPGYDIQSVIAGARPSIDPRTLPDPSGDSIGRTALTGDVGVVLRPNDRLNLLAHYGRSYRHPNLEELLFAGPATIGSIAPNVTVEPEKGDNFDVGVKLRAARWAGSLSYFNNRYKGFISTEITALTAGSSVSQAINFADVRIQGVEGDVEAPFSAGRAIVTLFANGAYNKGDVLEGNNPLTGASIANTPQDNITPLKLVLGARLSDKKGHFRLEYMLRHQKDVDRVAVTLRESPFLIYQDLASLGGFTLQRLSAGWDFSRKGNSFGLTLNLENLANRFYREHFQFAPARGRSLTVGLRVRRM
jgi:outer membrane receptor protein involved in Fe transport